jgi:drug/metabolite transporter (DMT)-like permease
VFHENFDRRIALGFALIVAGSVVLSWEGGAGGRLVLPLGVLALIAACLSWAVDNNLTQKVSGADPVGLAAIKGGTAGGVNLALALATGEHLLLLGAVLRCTSLPGPSHTHRHAMSRPCTGTRTTRTSTIATATVDAWAGV